VDKKGNAVKYEYFDVTAVLALEHMVRLWMRLSGMQLWQCLKS
jgi:hypothetical protein